MKYPTRIYYTETDKGLMWDRCKRVSHYTRLPDSLVAVIHRYKVFLHVLAAYDRHQDGVHDDHFHWQNAK